MKVSRLSEMMRGWFIGNFDPTLYNTNDVEVAVKEYIAGEYEECHHHRIATEITVVVSGTVEMNGVQYVKGDMIVIEPYRSTDFRAVTDCINVVVKLPGANDDKYLGKFND